MDEPVPQSFGRWIRRRRKALDLTQDALAAVVGCSKDLIVKIEGDARRPSRQVAELLAAHLQLAPEERADFIRAARAELAVDRLPPPTRSVLRPVFAPALATELAPLPPGNLPAEISSFVGRERELAELAALFGRPELRLVTLTGAGGSGKTRLALRVAEALVHSYPDGAWFVDLSPIGEPQLVAATTAQALSLKELPGQTIEERLLGWLRAKRLLLVLDNFERVVDAAPLVTQILRAAPAVRALATSRVPLRLTGEQEYPVGALALPPVEASDDLAQYDAVRLFVERARAVRLDFAVTAASAPAVAAICARLEGMPLAIELAAARMRSFSPAELLARLQQALLPTLAGGARDLPDRQQTIQATIEWSYQLLSAPQQRLLARLAVFVGGWTAEAAEAVCGEPGLEVAAGLDALVEHGLVRPIGQRYTMLETVREFALLNLKSLGAYEDCSRRYAQYFIHYVEGWQERTKNQQSSELLDALEPEFPNLESAMRWCHDRALTEPAEADLGLQLVASCFWAWEMRRPEMLARWLPEVLSPDWPALPTRARAFVLNNAWRHSWGADHWERVTQWVEEGLALARELADQELEAEALSHLGEICNQRRDYTRAEQYFSAGLAMARATDNRLRQAWALHCLAKVALPLRKFEQAEADLATSEALFKQIGNLFGQQVVISIQARLAWARRRYREAIDLLMRVNEIELQINHIDGTFYGYWNIGILDLILGDDRHAVESFVAARRYVNWEMAGHENWAVVLAIWQGITTLIRCDRVGMLRQSRDLLDTPIHYLDVEDAYRFGKLLAALADLDDASLEPLDLKAAAIRERIEEFASNELGNLVWRAIDAAHAAIGARALTAFS